MTACLWCEIEIKRGDKNVKCMICKEKLHIQCSKLSESELKIINDNENVNFTCKICNKIDMRSQINELRCLIQECITKLDNQAKIAENNNEVISKIEANKVTGNKKETTYAGILSRKNEVILIKPLNEEQKNDITRKDIKENIDPSKLSLGIEKMTNVRNGGVVISCADSNSKGVIKNKVQDTLSEKYKVEEITKRNPKIIIVGVEEDFINLENDELRAVLIDQNKLMHNKFKVLAKYKKKNKKNVGSIILETEADSYKEIIGLKKVKLGWRICSVYDHVNVTRCYKCAGFAHIAKDCTSEERCYICADNHTTKECTATKSKCINCVKAIEKYNIKLDENHRALDLDCPCYKREVERIAERISLNI